MALKLNFVAISVIFLFAIIELTKNNHKKEVERVKYVSEQVSPTNSTYTMYLSFSGMH